MHTKALFRQTPFWPKLSKEYLASVLFIAITWVVSHPFNGIRHDSILYTAQALSRTLYHLNEYDIFFKFGSQDSFTIFSEVYSLFIRIMGLNAANIFLLIVSQLAWIICCMLLFNQIRSGRCGVMGIALIVSMPAQYGGYGIFSYAESFLTPRVIAEALVFLSLYTTCKQKPLLSSLILLFSSVIHPLVAISGWFTIFIYYLLGDLRLAFLLVIAAIVLLVAWAIDLEPLCRMTQTIDNEWLSIIRTSNNYVFPSFWRASDWARSVFNCTIILLTCTLLRGRHKKLLIAILISSIIGVLTSIVGGDYLNNLLVVQLQLWRGTWLLSAASHFSIALLIAQIYHGENRYLALSLLAAAWSTIPLLPSASFILLTIFLVVVFLGQNGRLPKFSTPPIMISCSMATIALGSMIVISSIVALNSWLPPQKFDIFKAAAILASIFPVNLILSCLIFISTSRLAKSNFQHISMGAIFFLCCYFFWDQRLDWDHYIEKSNNEHGFFLTPIPAESNVYWEDDLKSAWLLLNRPNFLSFGQASGLLFSRRTAIEFISRKSAIQNILGPFDRSESVAPFSPSDSFATPTKHDIVNGCFSAEDLDFLILTVSHPGLHQESISLQNYTKKIKMADGRIIQVMQDKLYLYDCAKLRRKYIESSTNG